MFIVYLIRLATGPMDHEARISPEKIGKNQTRVKKTNPG